MERKQSVKDIIVKIIPAKIANNFIKKYHYSGKTVVNSQLHFGCFLDNKLHGVLSYGPSIAKRKIIGLVKDTKWNEFIELNRMAFDDYLPKNSESRCIAISIKMIKKYAPHIKWIISFADATQCGDGTIYRASNFILTGIKKNTMLLQNETTGDVRSVLYFDVHHPEIKHLKKDYEPIKGHQLRYIYLIDKNAELTVPIIPFSKIEELGVGMYKGQKR